MSKESLFQELKNSITVQEMASNTGHPYYRAYYFDQYYYSGAKTKEKATEEIAEMAIKNLEGVIEQLRPIFNEYDRVVESNGTLQLRDGCAGFNPNGKIGIKDFKEYEQRGES